MNKITKFTFTYLLLFSCLLAVAQTPERTGGERMLNALNEKLELTDEQYAKVKVLIVSQRQRIDAVRAADDLEAGEKMKALKDVRSSFNESMSTVLDEAQYARFEAMRNELSQRRGESKQMRKGERPSKEAMAKKREEMKKRREIMQPKLQQMRADFDKEISRKDRKQLKKLRTAFEASKAARKADREKMKAQETRPSKEEMIKRVKKEGDAMKDEREALDKLVEKYREKIAAAFEANPELKEFMSERHKPNGRFKMGKDNDKQRAEKKKEKMAGKFLLLNPEI